MPTYRSDGAWGSGTGANLTVEQFDGNTYEFATRLTDLETNPPSAAGIASIAASGINLIVTLTDSTVSDPIPMPVLVFRSRGEWQPSTLYEELDSFFVAGEGTFVVLLDHTSAATFDPDAAGAAVAAGSFEVARRYLIATVGTTDFTLIGASSNAVGVEFVATGVGSGTGTATPKIYLQQMTVENLSGGAYTTSVPTEGGTTTAAEGELRHILNPAAALAAHTLILPPNPSDGQIYELMTRQVVTALSVLYDAEGSPLGPDDSPAGTTPFMLTPNGGASWIYSTSIADWTRRY